MVVVVGVTFICVITRGYGVPVLHTLETHTGSIGKTVVCIAIATDDVTGDHIKTITWPLMKNILEAWSVSLLRARGLFT